MVPLATWSPFGMSQGFAGSPVSLASLGSPSVVVSLWGRVSVSSILPGVSPFGVASGFPCVSLSIWFPLSFLVAYAFSSSFSSVDASISSVSFLGVFLRMVASASVLCSPLVWFCVPALLLILSVRAALFLASVFSSLRPLHPAFRFFLVWGLAGSSPSLPRSDLSSLSDGVALWDESFASVGSFIFSGFLVGLCILLTGSLFLFLSPGFFSGHFLSFSIRVCPSGSLFSFVLLHAFVSFSVGYCLSLLPFLGSPCFYRSGLLRCFAFVILFLLGFPREDCAGSFSVHLGFLSMFFLGSPVSFSAPFLLLLLPGLLRVLLPFLSHVLCLGVCAPWVVALLFGVHSSHLPVLLLSSLRAVQFPWAWGRLSLVFPVVSLVIFPFRIFSLFRQNTYLQNKKHTLTCQGGTGCYRFNYQPGS